MRRLTIEQKLETGLLARILLRKIERMRPKNVMVEPEPRHEVQIRRISAAGYVWR